VLTSHHQCLPAADRRKLLASSFLDRADANQRATILLTPALGTAARQFFAARRVLLAIGIAADGSSLRALHKRNAGGGHWKYTGVSARFEPIKSSLLGTGWRAFGLESKAGFLSIKK
jgi:hypothetical protein